MRTLCIFAVIFGLWANSLSAVECLGVDGVMQKAIESGSKDMRTVKQIQADTLKANERLKTLKDGDIFTVTSARSTATYANAKYKATVFNSDGTIKYVEAESEKGEILRLQPRHIEPETIQVGRTEFVIPQTVRPKADIVPETLNPRATRALEKFKDIRRGDIITVRSAESGTLYEDVQVLEQVTLPVIAKEEDGKIRRKLRTYLWVRHKNGEVRRIFASRVDPDSIVKKGVKPPDLALIGNLNRAFPGKPPQQFTKLLSSAQGRQSLGIILEKKLSLDSKFYRTTSSRHLTPNPGIPGEAVVFGNPNSIANVLDRGTEVTAAQLENPGINVLLPTSSDHLPDSYRRENDVLVEFTLRDILDRGGHLYKDIDAKDGVDALYFTLPAGTSIPLRIIP